MASVFVGHVDDLEAEEPQQQAASGAPLLVTNEGAGAAHADDPAAVLQTQPARGQLQPQAQGKESVRSHAESERLPIGPGPGVWRNASLARANARDVYRRIVDNDELSVFQRASQNVAAAAMLFRGLPESATPEDRRAYQQVRAILERAVVPMAESVSHQPTERPVDQRSAEHRPARVQGASRVGGGQSGAPIQGHLGDNRD